MRPTNAKVGLSLGAFLFASHLGAQTTSQYLQAPRIPYQLNVQWRTKEKVLLWEIPGAAPATGKIGSDSLFVANRAVRITYPRLNPLKVRASASAKAIDDPAHATIVDLIKAITSVATGVAPSLPSSDTKKSTGETGTKPRKPNACSDVDSAKKNAEWLQNILYGSDSGADSFGKKVKGWIDDLDHALLTTGNGADAVQVAATTIETDAGTLADVVKTASEFAKAITTCANDLSLPDGLRFQYVTANLTKASTDARIDQLSNVVDAMKKLAKTLRDDYGDASRWVGPRNADFQINDPTDPILPTSDKMQKVTVKVYLLTLKVDERTGGLSVEQEDAGSADFTVRLYSLFIPEPGVGVVISKLKAPKYGTAKNDNGETVVARVDDTPVSVNPTVMVNFLCRCGLVRFAPMFQIGAAASKDTPALLFGGGVRLFSVGKGDVAIGGGWLVAWVKDLQKLHVGSMVSGTKDIDTDLGFSGSPRTRAYFSIQIKF